MISKYDFQQFVLDEDWVSIDTYMESMKKEEDKWSWYNEIVSDLELDDFNDFEEYKLTEAIRNWIYNYIFD